MKKVIQSHFLRAANAGPPRTDLLALYRNATDTIGVSTMFDVVSGTTWDDIVFKAKAHNSAGASALYAADDGTFYNGTTPIELSLTQLELLKGPQFFFNKERGLALYSTAQTGETFGKIVRYMRGSERLVTIAVGSSIAAGARYDSANNRWGYTSDIQLANTLSGAPMEFGVITPGTYSDKYGVYGYSGATLNEINADVTTDLYDAVDSAGVVPDLVIGHSLLENNITQGRSYNDSVDDLNAWISTVQTRYPNAKILICLPRPSFSYDTEAKQTVYSQLTSYINGLNGVYVADVQEYEDPANPARPLTGYTDATVHPNVRGALVCARSIAAKIKQIVGEYIYKNNRIESVNMLLTGSASLSGTYRSGTIADNVGPADDPDGVKVATAEDPGQKISYTVTPNATRKILGFDWFGSLSVSSPSVLYPYAIIEIVSGAENLACCDLVPRVQDGGGNTFQNYLTITSGDTAKMDWQNGDILTFRRPATVALSGSISAVTNYIQAQIHPEGGTTVIRVLSHGVEIVE